MDDDTYIGIYDLDEPPYSFKPLAGVVASHNGLVLKKQVANYLLMLNKLGISSVQSASSIISSQYNYLTLKVMRARKIEEMRRAAAELEDDCDDDAV